MVGAQEEEIPDNQKTVFDWCQEGNLTELKNIVSKGSKILELQDPMGEVAQWLGRFALKTNTL